MNINIIKTNKGNISHCKLSEKQVISTTSDFLDILLSCKTNIVAIDKESLANRFFDLKSGLAGDFLQKVSNYRKKLIVIGDFADIKSDSLKCFIYESNRGGDVLFVDNIDSGIELLH